MESSVGSVAPYAFTATFLSDEFDLSEVTTVSFLVHRPAVQPDEPDEWDATVVSTETVANGTRVVATHPYVEGDLPIAETLRVIMKVTLPDDGGTVYSPAYTLNVSPRY